MLLILCAIKIPLFSFRCSIRVNGRSLIWIGMVVGSTVGGFLPLLWGGDLLSFSGLFGSGAGGILGIWLGYKVGTSI